MYDLQLKRIRRERGMKQQDVASALGVSVKVYGGWERQDTEFPVSAAIEVAELFGCTLDELAGKQPPPKPTVSSEQIEKLLDGLGIDIK